MEYTSKGDAISEKMPYGGISSAILNQLFVHVCDSIYGSNCTKSNESVFCRC